MPQKTNKEINRRLAVAHGKNLIVDTVRKLKALARLPKLSKPQREESKALMRELREHGFTNADISVIVDGKWKAPTIKKDTRGVKTLSTDERDELLRLLSDFASKGGTISDIEEYQSFKQTLNNVGVSPPVILNFVGDIIRQGYQVEDLMNVKDLLVKSDLTFDDFLKHLVILEDLKRQGIFDQELIVLNNMARAYGGLKGINTALRKYGDIETIKNFEIQARFDLSVLQSEVSKLDARATTLKPFVDFAETLITQFSFNLESLETLEKVAKKYGGLTSILNALTEYGSIHELRLEKAKEIKICRNLKIQTDAETLEIINLSEKLREMHQDIGEINANYAKSLLLQKIHDLLTKPRKAQIEPKEFLRLISALLSGILEHAESNQESLKDWDKVELNIELCRVKINDILLGS